MRPAASYLVSEPQGPTRTSRKEAFVRYSIRSETHQNEPSFPENNNENGSNNNSFVDPGVMVSGHMQSPYGWKNAFAEALSIWLRVFLQCVPFLFVFSMILLFYYFPVIVLTHDLLDTIHDILYKNLLWALIQLSVYSCYVSSLVAIFGFHACRYAIYFIAIPFCACGVLFTFPIPIPQSFSGLASIFLCVIAPYLMFYLIWKTPYHDHRALPDRILDCEANSALNESGARGHESHIETAPKPLTNESLAHDGTPQALVRGWVGFSIIFPLFSFSIDTYIRVNFVYKMIIRLIIMPTTLWFLSSVQQYVLIGLSLEHMEKRLLVSVCVSQLLQFLGRLMVSNTTGSSSSSSTLSTGFIIVNIGMTVVDVISRLTYINRRRHFLILLSYTKNLQRAGLALLSYLLHRIRRGFGLGSATENAREHPNVDSPIQDYNYGPDSQEDDDLQYVKQFRARQLIHEMGAEIRILVFVPMMMYFFHPINPGSTYHTISTTKELADQIFFQLMLQFFGDIICLFVEVWHHQIDFRHKEIGIWDRFFIPKLTTSLVCVLYVQTFVTQLNVKA